MLNVSHFNHKDGTGLLHYLLLFCNASNLIKSFEHSYAVCIPCFHTTPTVDFQKYMAITVLPTAPVVGITYIDGNRSLGKSCSETSKVQRVCMTIL